MRQLVDIVRNSLPVPAQLVLEGVDQTKTGIVVRVASQALPQCPACAGYEVTHHSQYRRTLRDLAWQGQEVMIHLRTRRFRCRNRRCGRQIFAERLPGLTTPRARETARLSEIVRLVGYALGGLPGARLLQRLGMKSSDDTVLRRVKQAGQAKAPRVRVLGVDDWAWRKHQNYGPILVDLKRQRVVDLLPMRSAASFAHWLEANPGVSTIVRDRSGLYADGGRQGAPNAVQINDRYHLVSNLSEAVERDVQQMQIQARADWEQDKETRQPGRLTLVEARRQRCRQARYERYQAVVELRRQGYTQLAIAERVGIDAETVARWLHALKFPERRIRSDRRQDRARFAQDPQQSSTPSSTRTHFSAGRVAALLTQPTRELAAAQRKYLNDFLRICPTAHELRRLVLQFRSMLRWRRSGRLRNWIETAGDSVFEFVAQFARTLRRDLQAVHRSIVMPWSNGPVEGHINRLKMLKRQMYGRAGFELLKARVLPFNASTSP